MKRRTLLCGALAGAALSPALTRAADAPRVLVVWYSKSGNTAAIGEMIAERTHADTFVIVPDRFYGRERPKISQDARREREERDLPALKGTLPDLSRYDLVFVGSPTWWYGLATPVMSFLDKVDFHGARVAGFNTYAGDGHLFAEELAAQAKNAKFVSAIGFTGTYDTGSSAEPPDGHAYQVDRAAATGRRLEQWLSEVMKS